MKKISSITAVFACMGLFACAPVDGEGDNIQEQGRVVAENDPPPESSEFGQGALHNVGLAHLMNKVDSGDLELSDDPATGMEQMADELASFYCSIAFECDKMQESAAAVKTKFGSIVRGKSRDQTISEAMLADLETASRSRGSNAPPSWVVSSIRGISSDQARGSLSENESKQRYRNIGKGERGHDGGDFGRIARGVSAASQAFWKAKLPGDTEDTVMNEIVNADLTGAASGATIGAATGGGAIAGAVIGGAVNSAAAYFW